MSLQLPADSLYEIIEYLAGDKSSLRSCLLVDRFCCKVAVRFLWREVWDAKFNLSDGYQAHVPLSILSTLNACFSNESKNLLHEYGIFIPTPTSKLPLFNYISFIQTLPLHKIELVVLEVLYHLLNINTPRNRNLVLHEMLRAFMNQGCSVKMLNYS